MIPARVERILIIKLSAIGDCLHATPVAESLRAAYPEAEIWWAVHQHCAAVVEGNPFIDRVVKWDRKLGLRGAFVLARQLRPQRFDISLDLQGLFKSALLGLLSGARCRVGPAEAREGAALTYHIRAAAHRDLPITRQLLLRGEAAGGQPGPYPMRLPITDAHRAAIETLMEQAEIGDRRLVILNPSAGKEPKQWRPERFGELARLLADERTVFATVGAPADAPLCEQIVALNPDVLNWCGKTSLLELGALFERCALFIGGDTGPMHMAQASGCRVLALFGPTRAEVLGPQDPRDRVISARERCEGCRSRHCTAVTRCMDTIQVDDVARVARELLSG